MQRLHHIDAPAAPQRDVRRHIGAPSRMLSHNPLYLQLSSHLCFPPVVFNFSLSFLRRFWVSLIGPVLANGRQLKRSLLSLVSFFLDHLYRVPWSSTASPGPRIVLLLRAPLLGRLLRGAPLPVPSSLVFLPLKTR